MKLKPHLSPSFSPVPEISWRRTSGVPFASKVKMKNSNAVLEIPHFQQEDAGAYECVAENRQGKNRALGRVSFHGQCGTACCFARVVDFHAFNLVRLTGKRFVNKCQDVSGADHSALLLAIKAANARDANLHICSLLVYL